VSAVNEPQVSWKALERDAVVVTPDGDEPAHVVEVVGDRTADIFGGLVIRLGFLDKPGYLPAERVRGIWPGRVEVDASTADLEALPPYQEPVVERFLPDGGFFTRLRRRLRP
jgi:hypothetical protein